MNDRDRILAALPPLTTGSCPAPPKPAWAAKLTVADFEQRFVESGGTLAPPEALMRLGPKKTWVEPGLELGLDPAAVVTTDLWEAEVAVTTADLAIAETGSLVLAIRPKRPRLASLTPEVHVAVLSRDQLVSCLEDVIERIEGTFVIVTGPSRTADIEGVIVRGAHGPRELWLIWSA